MPGTLYQMPKEIAWDNGSTLPGATLTFSQTGTSTPQNVYTDVALSVAHSNPVTADAEGLFAPIYLDPKAPVDYRVVFKDSAGTTIYTVDDVPATAGSTTTLRVESASPSILFSETDASANNKNWRFYANGEQFFLQTGNDAEDTWTTILTLTRAGVLSGNYIVDASSGIFTATLTGMTTATTGQMNYRQWFFPGFSGTLVSLYRPGGIGDFAGTSNTTAFTMTGLPAAIRPSSTAAVLPCLLYDNSGLVIGGASVSGSTITFRMGSPMVTTGFTNSGSKGLPESWQLNYWTH